jgi:hypothetical protein
VFPERPFPESGKRPAIVAGFPGYCPEERCRISGNAEMPSIVVFIRTLISFAGLPGYLFRISGNPGMANDLETSRFPDYRKPTDTFRKPHRLTISGCFPQHFHIRQAIAENAKVKVKSEKQRLSVSRLFFCALSFTLLSYPQLLITASRSGWDD